MKLVKKLGILLACFCSATIIAQMIGLTLLLSKMGLDYSRWLQLQAVIYEVDLEGMQIAAQAEKDPEEEKRLKVELELKIRSESSPEIINRNKSISETLAQVKVLESKTRKIRQNLLSSEKTLEDSLQRQETDIVLQSHDVIQLTLASLKPTLVKNHLMEMIKEGELDEAAKIIKSIPASKQKKIFGEFKSADESKQLNNILQIIGQLTSQPGIGEGVQ